MLRPISRFVEAWRYWGWRTVMLCFLAGPIAWATGYAMLSSLGGMDRQTQTLDWQAWSAALNEPGIVGSLAYSLTVAVVVTAVVSLISLGLLIVLPTIRQRPTFLLSLMVLLGTPALVLSQMVASTLGPGGWLARWGAYVGLIESTSEFPVLINDRYSVGMLLAIVLSLLPLTMLYFSQLWNAMQLDRRCQLAQSLGAALWQARLQVALPMLVWRGRSLLMLVFILALGSFEAPLLLGRQAPQMFSVALQRWASGFDLSLRPQAFVLAVIYVWLTSLMLLCYIRARQAHE